MKRLISMDILRGIALMLMVVFHIFLNISELTSKALTDLSSLTIFELILVAFIAIFIHWQGFFLMISAIVHWYSMSKLFEKGISAGQILKKQLIFGVALYVFGFLREPLLSPWGIIATWFNRGAGSTPIPWELWGFIYRMETLSSVGSSVVLTSIIFALFTLLSKSKAQESLKMAIKIIILAGLSAAVIFVAPTVQEWVNSVSGIILQEGDASMHEGFRNTFDYSIRWLLNSLGGREFPTFPNYGYFLAGSIIGLVLSQPKPTKRIILFGIIIGIILTGAGAYYWLFVDNFLVTLDIGFYIHPTGFVIFSIGLECVITMIYLAINEFNPRLHDERRLKRRLFTSRIFRRWGILALTIFTFNILEFVPRAIFTRLVPSVNFQSAPLTWTVLVIVVLLLLWEGIIRLWELIKFKGSVEWLFLRLFKIGKPYNKADPLDVKGNLYDVEPILFV